MVDVAVWDAALVGRETELDFLGTFLADAALRGGSLLISGEPGAGKTVLLEAAAELAAGAGTQLLRGSGAEFETAVSYSGLNQLLIPLLEEFRQLPATLHTALEVVLGLGDGPAPDRLVVCNATLALLGAVAVTTPTLVIVDDLQWLDRSSTAVMSFVARRLHGSRVGFLAAFRSGAESLFERAGLAWRELRPLDDVAATRLVRTRFPNLAPRVLRRVLQEAQGNPLALIEFSTAVTHPRYAAAPALPTTMPPGRRVQALYAGRVSELPESTMTLLLLAVLDGSGDLGVLQAAAALELRGLDDLAPAERAQLVDVHESTGRLAFRHPLIKSAVMELSTHHGRRAAHRHLANVGVAQPDRRAWHLAQAAVEPDEEVARLLEGAAQRILRRGDAVGAIEAMIRAADLSPSRSDRSRRLADAAYVGADVTGELRTASQLLIDARRVDPELGRSLNAATATAYLLLNGDGEVDSAHRLLVGVIENALRDRDADDAALVESVHVSETISEPTASRSGANAAALVEALYTLVLVCHFGGRTELWVPFHGAIARLEPAVPTVLRLLARTYADPLTANALTLDQVDTEVGDLDDELDPARIVRVGIAAFYVDRLAGCREALWRVVHDGRDGGAVASGINALMMLCFDTLQSGQWNQADQLAEEGVEFCDRHGYRLLAWPGRYAQGLLAAARGDDDTTRAVTDEMERWAAPRGVRGLVQYSRHVRTLAALGRGDFEEAYRQAVAISPAGVLASHAPQALRACMDLVEAAVRTGRDAEACAHVAAIKDAGVAAISPRLALLAAGSAALAATDHSAGDLFKQALAIPGIERWPFELARVRLAYGEHLRRRRATTESRRHLTAALDSFRLLGARPWANRAANELRATGQTRQRHTSTGAPALLTPQEHETALLAAAGMTNKEIAARLYLSPRTVSAHLYSIFPKLGITSRAALRDALAPPPTGPSTYQREVSTTHDRGRSGLLQRQSDD